MIIKSSKVRWLLWVLYVRMCSRRTVDADFSEDRNEGLCTLRSLKCIKSWIMCEEKVSWMRSGYCFWWVWIFSDIPCFCHPLPVASVFDFSFSAGGERFANIAPVWKFSSENFAPVWLLRWSFVESNFCQKICPSLIVERVLPAKFPSKGLSQFGCWTSFSSNVCLKIHPSLAAEKYCLCVFVLCIG